MASSAQLESDLLAVRDQIVKVGGETQTLISKVAELEAIIAAGGGTTPGVDAALQAVKDQLKIVDDLVKDPEAPAPSARSSRR